jgi:hypothetical protein
MLDAPHAGRAKALSRHLDPSTIDRRCDVRLMLDILLAKAEQDAEFRNCLRSTGTQTLVHSTHPKDTFWATGLSADLRSFERGKGANVFGLLLEIVRATLRPEVDYAKQLSAEPTPPPKAKAPAPVPALPMIPRLPGYVPNQRPSPLLQPIPPCRSPLLPPPPPSPMPLFPPPSQNFRAPLLSSDILRGSPPTMPLPPGQGHCPPMFSPPGRSMSPAC